MTVATMIPVGSVSVALKNGDRIVGSLKDRGPFEPATLARWGELCAARGVVIDVGAYTGLFSIAARLLGARAIPFEPMPFNRERFKENAQLNHVRTQVNSEAVSDRVGDTTITYNPAVEFTAGASLVRKNGTQLTVKTLTIDSLELDGVRAIKIDVERAEGLVLAGARQTLERCKPDLLVEILDDERKAEIFGLLDGLYTAAENLDQRNWWFRPC